MDNKQRTMSELNRKESGMKIISAELNNFQSLSHKVVDIQGKSIVVVGKNGGSKSTILRAIQSPINSVVVPTKAIKDGEESAHIKLVIKGDLDGEDKTFKYMMSFSESNQKGSVSVIDEEGNKITNKSMQRDIIGDVSFDVDEFIRLGVTSSGKISQTGLKEQVEVLRQFLTDEEKQNLQDLDNEYKSKFEERADTNKTVKILKANLSDATDITEEEVVKYKEDKSKELEEVSEKLMNMADSVVKYENNKRKFLENKEWLTKYSNTPLWLHACVTCIKELSANGHPDDANLRSLTEYADFMQNESTIVEIKTDEQTELKAWFKANKEPKQDELKAKQSELSEYVKKYTAIKEVVVKHSEITKQEAKSKKFTKRLKAIQDEKKKSFETSKLPVKGLSFDEEGVYYKGLPFNGDHHPSSTIIAVGVQLAIAMNPNLKCIFIKDGSLFDKETFARVLKFVERNGYQLFIEMVDWNAGSDAEVKFAEQFINK
jgi:AAA15 family ATPase/GTPase